MDPPSKPLPINQEEFERAILQAAVSIGLKKGMFGETEAAIWREQIDKLERGNPWGSGVGFLVSYGIPEGVPRLPPKVELYEPSYVLRGVEPRGTADLITRGVIPLRFAEFGFCGVSIDTRGGTINGMDAHTYGSNSWPEDSYDFWILDLEASE